MLTGFQDGGRHMTLADFLRRYCFEPTWYSIYLLYWYKVRILTQKALVRPVIGSRALRVNSSPLYLLYWYKSANTDAKNAGRTCPQTSCAASQLEHSWCFLHETGRVRVSAKVSKFRSKASQLEHSWVLPPRNWKSPCNCQIF